VRAISHELLSVHDLGSGALAAASTAKSSLAIAPTASAAPAIAAMNA
jgi:hypothetical protein